MTESPPMVSVGLRIFGRVQAVGYRAWAVNTARRLALLGWVRNLTDGSVEAFVYGSEADVAAFIAACQGGPPLARVIEVRTQNRVHAPDPPADSGFAALLTATPED